MIGMQSPGAIVAITVWKVHKPSRDVALNFTKWERVFLVDCKEEIATSMSSGSSNGKQGNPSFSMVSGQIRIMCAPLSIRVETFKGNSSRSPSI